MSPAKRTSEPTNPTKKYGRYIVYDREIFIAICRRVLQGEDVRDVCAKPPMPTAPVFLDWVRQHPEARDIYRSVFNLETDRALAARLGLVLPIPSCEWEEDVRLNLKRGFPADWIEREYVPPDWRKVYPLVGYPPVWRTESMQVYEVLINAKTELVEPRDEIELKWTKESADADWEARRLAAKKSEWLARNFNRALRADFKYYQALDLAYTRALKRGDSALHQIARWRKGLGAKVRALPDRFLDEELLAKRYGVDELPGCTEGDESATHFADLVPPVAPDGKDAARTSSPGCLGEAVEAAPNLERAHKCAQAVQSVQGLEDDTMEDDTMEAASTLADLAAAGVASKVVCSGQAADSCLMPTAGAPPDEPPPMVARVSAGHEWCGPGCAFCCHLGAGRRQRHSPEHSFRRVGGCCARHHVAAGRGHRTTVGAHWRKQGYRSWLLAPRARCGSGESLGGRFATPRRIGQVRPFYTLS